MGSSKNGKTAISEEEQRRQNALKAVEKQRQELYERLRLQAEEDEKERIASEAARKAYAEAHKEEIAAAEERTRIRNFNRELIKKEYGYKNDDFEQLITIPDDHYLKPTEFYSYLAKQSLTNYKAPKEFNVETLTSALKTAREESKMIRTKSRRDVFGQRSSGYEMKRYATMLTNMMAKDLARLKRTGSLEFENKK
ncbi:MAG: hypothetical protein IJS60_08910 [Abditibacteriota bacterium]|nr:hypothetical protein [Abditibacteriota bacterium]